MPSPNHLLRLLTPILWDENCPVHVALPEKWLRAHARNLHTGPGRSFVPHQCPESEPLFADDAASIPPTAHARQVMHVKICPRTPR